jgi:hypothetical protein
LLLAAGTVRADPPPAKAPPMGSEVGAEVAPFFARAITGPDAGKTLCYVCKYRQQPVVLVFVRKFESGLEDFLRSLDREVESRWRQNLRACVFFCGESPMKLQPRLVNLAFDLKLHVPLAIPAEYQTGPSALQLDPDAAVTLVLYRELKVVQTIQLPAGKLTAARARTLVPAISTTLFDPQP